MLVFCTSTQDIMIEILLKGKEIAKAFGLYLQYIDDYCFHFRRKSLISGSTPEKGMFSDSIYIPLAHST